MKMKWSTLAAALVFSAFAAGVVVGKEEPVPVSADTVQPGTDAWISMHVKEQLTNAKEIPASAISVATINGVVMLAGIVDTPEQVQKSIAIAKATQGVRNVDSTALNSRH